MRFANYWANGCRDWKGPNPRTGMRETFASWGWSDVSHEDAVARGRERAAMIAQGLQPGQKPDHHTYGDRPFKEQVLEKWDGADGRPAGVISLNSYGCDILNTAHTAFVDIDLEDGKDRGSRENKALGDLEFILRREDQFGAHVYRTAGGLRYLLTLDHADPGGDHVTDLMTGMGADPLYVRLCRIQGCFRARLTPKSWRCGMGERIHIDYPISGPDHQASVADWRRRYRDVSKEFSVCRRIGYFGKAHDTSEDFDRVLELHDRETKATIDLPLA